LNLAAPPACAKCAREKEAAEALAHKQHQAQEREDAINAQHYLKVKKIQDQIDLEEKQIRLMRLQEDNETTLLQKEADLTALKAKAKAMQRNSSNSAPDSIASYSKSNSNGDEQRKQTRKTKGQSENLSKQLYSPSKSNKVPASTVQEKWERMKRSEGAVNPAIDEIMAMIGLEEVKRKILAVKSKIENAQRQGIDLTEDRMGMSLLGNPGTGQHHVSYRY